MDLKNLRFKIKNKVTKNTKQKHRLFNDQMPVSIKILNKLLMRFLFFGVYFLCYFFQHEKNICTTIKVQKLITFDLPI